MSVLSAVGGASIGVAVGEAGATVLEPALEGPRQEAWKESKARILDLNQLARLVAQALLSEEDVSDDAERNGYAVDQLVAAVQLALRAPSIAEALELWRRGDVDEEQFNHALAKAQLEGEYWQAMRELFTTRVPADLLAFAHQRGIVDNPKDPVTGQLLIPVSAPTTTAVDVDGQPSPIRQQPVQLDVLAEFKATGWDFTRAAVNARARGLPPAPGELLQLVNRGVISTTEYYAGIGEGDTRNEWRDYLLQLRRRLLTPHEYAELQLRGYLDAEQRDAGAALSGMEPADAQLLYDVLGRSINVHGITTGLARGGVFAGPIDQIPAAYLQSLQRGNLRPEYYNLGYANRFNLPSAFVVRALLKDGALSSAQAEELFVQSAWPPELAKLVADHYAPTGAGAGKQITAAQHATLYEAGAVDRAQLTAELETLGYGPDSAETYAAYVDAKHLVSARTALVAALKKAVAGGGVGDNDATFVLNEISTPPAVIAPLLRTWHLIGQVESGQIDTSPPGAV